MIHDCAKFSILISFTFWHALADADSHDNFLDDDSICSNNTCAVSLLQHSAAIRQRALSEAEMLSSSRLLVNEFPAIADDFPVVSMHMKKLFGWMDGVHLIDGLPSTFVDPAYTVIYCCILFYVLWTLFDITKLGRYNIWPREQSTYDKDKDPNGHWTATGIWMLCFYRLYTGFLAATWLPYVLAMEGEAFWPENQALFMGIAKLIYGVTVLMNPMFGLIGDMLAEICEGAARRLWILLGIVLSAFGILVCMWAGPRHDFLTYMTGIFLWRLGESLNDVTTEAIVPDLVPVKQFGVASAIKAASFVAGGLLGYIALYFMAAVHYTWCYYAYMACMFITAIPSLTLLNRDAPAKPNKFREGKTFAENMSQSYVVPFSMKGGFPEISWAIFVMSCGTAPMFFFLLIIRDLLGVHNEISLSKDFAIGSILFFLGATIATAIDVIWGGRAGPQSRGAIPDGKTSQQLSPAERFAHIEKMKEWEKEKVKRLQVLVWLSGAFALSVLILPLCQFLPTLTERFELFYPLTALFGLTFGLGYSRFQDATWRVLPVDCDMANAMGFNVMARNFGLGVGNFGFGCILEAFKVYHPHLKHTTTTTTTYNPNLQILTSAHQVYTPTGYDIMCIGCCICNISAGYLTLRLKRMLEREEQDSVVEGLK